MSFYCYNLRYALGIILMLSLSFFFIPASASDGAKNSLKVTASAYLSRKSGKPSITAWGDKLVPGMKAIAVSRDLIRKGLTHGTEVEIEGLPGTYKVMDKMHRKWRRKIDIYMGTNRKAAKKWGKRKVLIRW
jgi:3D (Asp-Asp-Asp) domain-containing protein